MPGSGNYVPRRGDRVEQRSNGVRRVGRVWYSDDLRVLVKWDDGRSSSLRVGRDRFWVGGRSGEEQAETAAHRDGGAPAFRARADGLAGDSLLASSQLSASAKEHDAE
jgi:hypothetical protein